MNLKKQNEEIPDSEAQESNMTSSEIIKAVLDKSEVKLKEIAELLNRTSSAFSNRIKRNALTADEFLIIIRAAGFDVNVVPSQESKEIRKRKHGVGKRVISTYHGIKYDTYYADAICHSDETKLMFWELYQQKNGDYFVVNYVNWANGQNTVTPIDNENAERLIASVN